MGVGTARMLWFFVWRMALWGAGLCALAAAVCVTGALLASGVLYALSESGAPNGGASNVGGSFYLVGAGAVFGVLGAFVGLVLGLLGGLLLFGLTRVLYYPGLASPARYRSVAGWACAAVAAVVLLGDWFANGYPNTEDFGLLRFVGDTNATPKISVLQILAFVVAPTLVLSVPMWFSGRLVAGRYVRRTREAGEDGRLPVEDRSPETT